MPVEIRELLIRTTIESSEPKPGAPASPEGGGSTPGNKSEQGRLHARLVKECVNQVMDSLATVTRER